MSFVVTVRPEALAQAQEIEAWWREHRPDSPDRFRVELAEAFGSLSTSPLPARLVRKRGPVYRCLLKVSRNHVYFTVDRDASVVHVIAIWGGPRRGRPRLPR